MQSLSSYLKNNNAVSGDSIDQLVSISVTKVYARGDVILRIGQPNRTLNFINEGLLKLSFYKSEKEFVMRFFREGEFCTALDSFLTQQPSKYTIIAIEDTHLTELNFTALDRLSQSHRDVEALVRRVSGMAIGNMMDRISEMLETNATERYLNFLDKNNHLINRVSLGDLSRFLGISPVSLSRLRSKV